MPPVTYGLHALAERLGGMTVRELRQRMDAQEFAEWSDYLRQRDQERVEAERRAELEHAAHQSAMTPPRR